MPMPGDMVPLFKEAFEIYDDQAATKKTKEAKNGKVNQSELGYVLRSVGLNPTDQEIAEVFKKYASGDMIDLEGANKAGNDFADKATGDHKKNLLEAFTVFDQKNQDTGANTGFVSTGEVRHILNNLTIDNITEEEVDEMICEVDPESAGVINYKQFVDVIFKAV